MFCFFRLVFIVPVHGSRNLQRLQFKVCASMLQQMRVPLYTRATTLVGGTNFC